MGFTWCCFSSTSPKEVGCLDEAQAKLSQHVIHCLSRRNNSVRGILRLL